MATRFNSPTDSAMERHCSRVMRVIQRDNSYYYVIILLDGKQRSATAIAVRHCGARVDFRTLFGLSIWPNGRRRNRLLRARTINTRVYARVTLFANDNCEYYATFYEFRPKKGNTSTP